MNLFAAFQSEVFRPLVTLLIPGAFGVSSWVLVLLWKYPHLKELALQIALKQLSSYSWSIQLPEC